jgi:hypothetical protein
MRGDDVEQMLAAYRERTVPDAATRAAMRTRLSKARRRPQPAGPRRIVLAVVLTSAIAAALLLLVRGAALLFAPTVGTASRDQASDEPATGSTVQEVVPAVPPRASSVSPISGSQPPPLRAEPPTPKRPRAPAVTPQPEPSRIAEEAVLLREAQAALRSGEHTKARKVLDDYTQKFPAGIMRSERDAIDVMLQCRDGGGEEARARARELLARREQASYAARIRSACGL